MKERLLILVTIIFVNLCYASFPVFNSNFAKEPDGDNSEYWGILGAVAFFGTIYLLVRTIWRAYRRDVPWVKKLLRWKNIWWLLLVIPIFLILSLLSGGGVSGL
jgi:hypothetical protein